MGDLFSNLYFGFSVSLAPHNLFACFMGVFVGTAIGVLPGLGPVATMSLLLPITIKMEPTAAIIIMAGVFYGAMYGGSTTSILLNLPGEASSVVTTLDGYQMARQGRAGPALAICAWGSFIAGTLGVLGITLMAPALAEMAVKIGPPELVALLCLSFLLVIQFSGGSRPRAAAAALLGFLLSTIGLDPVESTPRYDFGTFTLMDGVGFAPLVIGLFGISEVLINLEKEEKMEVFQGRIKGLWPTRQDWRDSAPAIGRGSIVGFFMGILPGMGTIVPPFLSYSLERRISKHPEKFGTGVIEGVAGPEAANNSATAGSMIPLLTLGIAPSAAVAVLTAAFLTHGVQPGPLLITEHPTIFWGVVTSMYTGNVLLLLLNLPLVGMWARLLSVPYRYLWPMILLFCGIGAYSVSNNPMDVLLMAVFGLLGYMMRKLDYPGAPLVLAFVLGQLFEEKVRQSLVISRGSYETFIAHPLALLAWIASAILLLYPLFTRGKSTPHFPREEEE